MSASWSPLSADWGTIADWMNVAGALIVGIALWHVARRTNKLGEAANDANKSLVELEHRRERDDEQERLNEQRLVLVTIVFPIREAFDALDAVRFSLSLEGMVALLPDHPGMQETGARMLERGKFSLPESIRNRLHRLEPQLGARVARAERACDYFASAFNKLGNPTLRGLPKTAEPLYSDLVQQVGELEDVLRACEVACREANIEFVAPRSRGPFKTPGDTDEHQSAPTLRADQTA